METVRGQGGNREREISQKKRERKKGDGEAAEDKAISSEGSR